MKGKEAKSVWWKSDRREEMRELKYTGSFLTFLFFTFKNKAEILEVQNIE